MSISETIYFSTYNAMWPDLAGRRAAINPPRNGVDRKTGKILQGWAHAQQSMETIFITPFHERVLRRWVGSYVPLILGESIVERIITRFFWAIASALDLWEPGYKINRVRFMGDALLEWAPAISPQEIISQESMRVATSELIRSGQAIFRQEGAWYPRGHLGDFTPYTGQEFDWVAGR